MDTMKQLVLEFEHRLWEIVGTLLPKSIPSNTTTSYVVEYQTMDESGRIFIMATNDNTLNIAFLQGTNQSSYREIFTTPFISSVPKAEEALYVLYRIFSETAYEGHLVTIEKYAELFKLNYVYSSQL